MNKGICFAGNMIVDMTYPISTWPNQNELAHITGPAVMTTGGCVCNTMADVARLDPTIRLVASGFAGQDPQGDLILKEMGQYPNVDLSMVQRNGDTSLTLVMYNDQTKVRTYFQYAGGNGLYGEEHIDLDKLNVDIFHIGYILLLDHLDEPDAEYGTRMARLLHHVQQKGIKTSIDVVSETGDRFRRLVTPALKYTDYCIINELEAGQTTGFVLRDEAGKLLRENIQPALRRMLELGVSTWAVIHCPEAGFGMAADGSYVEMPSVDLPKSSIQGTVGAGDAFCAGVLLGAAKEWSLEEALRLGNCAAVASLTRPGPNEGVGTVEQVMKLYDQYGYTPQT